MVIIPGNDEVHPRAVGENLHRILPHSELHPPVFSPEGAESLRQQDPDGFVDIGHERRAAIYLPFLERVMQARSRCHSHYPAPRRDDKEKAT